MKKRLVYVVVGVSVIAAAAAGCGGGGSSDNSSAWSDSDVARVESKLADKLTEEGVTPTKAGTECLVKGLEPLASASEVLENADTTPQQDEEIQEITTNCLGDSAALESSNPLEGLPACEEDEESSACIEEAEERGLNSIGEEPSEEYAEEEYSEEEYNPNYQRELEEFEEVKPPSEK